MMFRWISFVPPAMVPPRDSSQVVPTLSVRTSSPSQMTPSAPCAAMAVRTDAWAATVACNFASEPHWPLYVPA